MLIGRQSTAKYLFGESYIGMVCIMHRAFFKGRSIYGFDSQFCSYTKCEAWRVVVAAC